MRSLLFFALVVFSHQVLIAQDTPLSFAPRDTIGGYQGFTALRLAPLPEDGEWPGAGCSGRGLFALHSYAVPYWGPTRDRANEAVLLGWNPMGRLQPEQPGFWWQYEWGYGQKSGPLFELTLDVRDSSTLGGKSGLRRISYKMERESGEGVSADFAFDNISFVRGSQSAGDRLRGNYLQVSPRANRMRVALNMEVKNLLTYSVLSHSTADATLYLPLERGNQFRARLIPLYGAISDSTHVILNSMEPGAHFTIHIRNERGYAVALSWEAKQARKLYWDLSRPAPDRIDAGETLIVRIIMDGELHAFGSVHGRFREDME